MTRLKCPESHVISPEPAMSNTPTLLGILVTLLVATPFLAAQQTAPSTAPATAPQTAPHIWTAGELFRRNIGTTAQQRTQFPPHKIIGNLYYVGTQSLSSFLLVTKEGN